MEMNEAEQLQELAARGWPALEREALGAWTLRASRGFTRRANSVLVVGEPGVSFAAVETRPAHRRRGLATAVMRALVDRAADDGATRAYLQVERDNRAALALYVRMGFVEHHRYHYRRAPRVG